MAHLIMLSAEIVFFSVYEMIIVHRTNYLVVHSGYDSNFNYSLVGVNQAIRLGIQKINLALSSLERSLNSLVNHSNTKTKLFKFIIGKKSINQIQIAITFIKNHPPTPNNHECILRRVEKMSNFENTNFEKFWNLGRIFMRHDDRKINQLL